jgi:hypothetical protein
VQKGCVNSGREKRGSVTSTREFTCRSQRDRGKH